MTPFDPDDLPLDDDDLAVAAVIDGDATAEQRRRVARDPALVTRLRHAEAAVAAVRAPLDSPGDDVFAALRARAVAALDETGTPVDTDTDTDTDVDTDVDPGAARPDHDDEGGSVDAGPARNDTGRVTPPPTDDLAARRARRPARRLPPLPAVAAVVVLLVLLGVGLLVSDRGSSEDRAGDAATAADDADTGTESEAGDSGAEAPSAAAIEGLLARTTTSYLDEEALFEALRVVDPTTLDLATAAVQDEPSSTTAGADGGEGTTAPAETAAAADGRGLAEDSDVTRCDSVMRSAEPDLGAATAAVFVAVDGVPVVILSNPVTADDGSPAGVRITALNALDCTPRGAVQR